MNTLIAVCAEILGSDEKDFLIPAIFFISALLYILQVYEWPFFE